MAITRMAGFDSMDVPLATGNLSRRLAGAGGCKFLTLRVPYPMGYYAKGLDGRIDNPNGGWKGKGHLHTDLDASAIPHAAWIRSHLERLQHQLVWL